MKKSLLILIRTKDGLDYVTECWWVDLSWLLFFSLGSKVKYFIQAKYDDCCGKWTKIKSHFKASGSDTAPFSDEIELIPGYLYCFLATSESWGLTLAESTGLALGLLTEPKYLTEIGEKKVWSKKNYSQSNINIIYCGLQLNNCTIYLYIYNIVTTFINSEITGS